MLLLAMLFGKLLLLLQLPLTLGGLLLLPAVLGLLTQEFLEKWTQRILDLSVLRKSVYSHALHQCLVCVGAQVLDSVRLSLHLLLGLRTGTGRLLLLLLL